MSNLLNSSTNGSTSSLSDGSGRPSTSFSGQSGTAFSFYHHAGFMQGLHNIQGNYNDPNFAGILGQRNSGLNTIPSAVVQQQSISHGSSHGLSGPTDRGGLGVSPILGNAGSRTSSIGHMVGGGTISGNIGENLMMGGVLPQGSPQVHSMLGNSYTTSIGLSQNQVQMNSLSSMGLLNDDTSLFDMNNDFPPLSRPSSAGGQGQSVSRSKKSKQGLGISPVVQKNQECSIQNKDFPALPGYKGSKADHPMDSHHKEQLNENSSLMMQSQQLSMERSGGSNLGPAHTSHCLQQQQLAQALSSSDVSLHESIFSSSHPSYHSQTGGPPSIGLSSMNLANSDTRTGYDQQQYHHQQNTPRYRLPQMSAVNQPFRDVGLNPMQATQPSSPDDRFRVRDLSRVINMSDPGLTTLARGIDLTKMGLDMTSKETLYKTFGSPFSNEPCKVDLEFSLPQCYYAKDPLPYNKYAFRRFEIITLFYIFYSMPGDEAQLCAAFELYNRGWLYHKEHKLWLSRDGQPLVKNNVSERGSYNFFDSSTFETFQKENFVLHYDMVEKKPLLPQHLV